MRTTYRLFKGTISALIFNFELFIRLSWAWLLLLTVLTVEIAIFLGDALKTPKGAVAFLIIVGVAGFCANASIAVGWHRCLLMQEVPETINIRFGRREWSYIGHSLLLFIMLLVGAALVEFLATFLSKIFLNSISATPQGNRVAVMVSAGVTFLFASYFMRLMLILPALALGRPISLSQAWNDGRDLGIPMVIATIGVGLIVGAIGIFLRVLMDISLVSSFFENFIQLKLALLFIVQQALSFALYIGIISGGYYILRERQGGRRSSLA